MGDLGTSREDNLKNKWALRGGPSGFTSFVTGAGGFVGSNLLRRCENIGVNTVGLFQDIPRAFVNEKFNEKNQFGDRISPSPNIFVFGSITNLDLISRILVDYEVDFLYHMAAQAIVPHALENPLETFNSNIMGTYTVLEAARRYGKLKGILIASSDKAYGTQKQLPYTEETPLNGIFPYDVSKVCADLLAQSYARTYDLPVVITRCANIYGPGDRNESRLIPSTILAALNSVRPIIRSDGTPSRDYVHIYDVVRGMTMLMHRADEFKGMAFNFGSGKPISVLELVTLILSLIKDWLTPDIRGTAKGEIDSQYLDATRAKTLLDWEPSIPLKEGLLDTIEWWKASLLRSGRSFSFQGERDEGTSYR